MEGRDTDREKVGRRRRREEDRKEGRKEEKGERERNWRGTGRWNKQDLKTDWIRGKGKRRGKDDLGKISNNARQFWPVPANSCQFCLIKSVCV